MEKQELFQLVKISLIVCVSAIVLLYVIKFLFERRKNRLGDDINAKFSYKILKTIIIIAACGTILYQIEPVKPIVKTILTSSGIIALALSLAAQASLTNLIDGFFISIFKPFNIGDRITIPDKNITGVVTSINLRHTTIVTYQNTSYTISNSNMSNYVIENSSANNSFSYPIDVSISYESDLEKAMEIMENVIAGHPDFYDVRTKEDIQNKVPKTIAFVRNFGDSGIELRCHMTTTDVHNSFAACSDVRRQLKHEFDKNGIVIPYQTITIKD